MCCLFFFFSSRRRHTRWPRDWSSDVCSSDLEPRVELARFETRMERDQHLLAQAYPDEARWLTTPQGELRSEEHTSELQSRGHLVCRLLLEQKKCPTNTPLLLPIKST